MRPTGASLSNSLGVCLVKYECLGTVKCFCTVCNRYFDFDKLREVTSVVTENLNKIIDINYYPAETARRSNLRHRPIGIGVQVHACCSGLVSHISIDLDLLGIIAASRLSSCAHFAVKVLLHWSGIERVLPV